MAESTTLSRGAAMTAAAGLARGLLRLLDWTYRTRPVGGWSTVDALGTSPTPVILMFWHNQTLLSFGVLRRLVKDGLGVTLMMSHSRDGELGTRVARPWGVRVNRGSTSRGGLAGGRGLYRDIVRHSASPVLAPDGPRGPIYEVQPGAVVLSSMARVPMVPMGFCPRASFRLRSWDRMHLAHPFTRLGVAVGEPIQAPERLGAEERHRIQVRVREVLHELTARAAESVGAEPPDREKTG